MVCVLTLKGYFVFSPQCWQMANGKWCVIASLFLLCMSFTPPHYAFFLGIFLAANGKGKKKDKNFHPQEHFCVSLATERQRVDLFWAPSIYIHSAGPAIPCGNTVELRMNTNTQGVSPCFHRHLWTWFISFTPQYVRAVPLWNGARVESSGAKRS